MIKYWSNPQNVKTYISSLAKYPQVEGGSPVAQDILCIVKAAALEGHLLERDLIVDIGCGPGNVGGSFVKHFNFKTLLAIDWSEPMLDVVPWYVDIEHVRTIFQKADVSCSSFNTGSQSAQISLLGVAFSRI